MKAGRFSDFWRGNGVFVSGSCWLIAIRWRWRLAFVCPPGKPGYKRWYIGPVEIETRPGGVA